MTMPSTNGRGHEVVMRQRGVCFYCGKPITRDWIQGKGNRFRGFVRDHLVPRSRGGLDANINRVAACAECDRAKGNRMPTHDELRKQSMLLGKDYVMEAREFCLNNILLDGPSDENELVRPELSALFERREDQLKRVIKSLSHIPYERRISIILSWMSIDDVDTMLETLERTG